MISAKICNLKLSYHSVVSDHRSARLKDLIEFSLKFYLNRKDGSWLKRKVNVKVNSAQTLPINFENPFTKPLNILSPLPVYTEPGKIKSGELFKCFKIHSLNWRWRLESQYIAVHCKNQFLNQLFHFLKFSLKAVCDRTQLHAYQCIIY